MVAKKIAPYCSQGGRVMYLPMHSHGKIVAEFSKLGAKSFPQPCTVQKSASRTPIHTVTFVKADVLGCCVGNWAISEELMTTAPLIC